MSLEAGVRRMWRGEAGVLGAVASAALLPAAAAFRAGVALRGAAFRAGIARTHDPEIPTVSVGNLTVGGTGKTPVAGWVVRSLLAGGRRPALVARGYGADELALHARWAPGVPVIADPDRVAGVSAAVARGAEVAVLDDAFQHRRIARDLDIVLVAAETPFPGRMLPRGPYREGHGALRRADVVVVTRKSAAPERARAVAAVVERVAPGVACARVHLAPGALVPLTRWSEAAGPAGASAGSTDPTPQPELADGASIRVVSGVAEPGTVEAAVRSLGFAVAERHDFPDHHEYTPEEFSRACAGADAVVITEKDAVKVAGFDASAVPVFVLTQSIRFESGEAGLRTMIQSLPIRGTEG